MNVCTLTCHLHLKTANLTWTWPLKCLKTGCYATVLWREIHVISPYKTLTLTEEHLRADEGSETLSTKTLIFKASCLFPSAACWTRFTPNQKYCVEYFREVCLTAFITSKGFRGDSSPHFYFTVLKYQPSDSYFVPRVWVTPILLPMAGGLERWERLLANRWLGAQVIATLIVMLLFQLLMLLLLFQLLMVMMMLLLLRHLYWSWHPEGPLHQLIISDFSFTLPALQINLIVIITDWFLKSGG